MSHKFFQNVDCAYFPCHTGVSEEDFNCLFCYCPFYLLKDCGGKCRYVDGVKVCTDCTFVHVRDNYEAVIKKIRERIL